MGFDNGWANFETARQHLLAKSRGPWTNTSTGGRWFLLDPRPEDVSLEDIVAGLKRTCRYGGQIRPDVEFYSVAEHCGLMFRYGLRTGLITTREQGLEILLHDASEAYLGDIPTPLKALLPDFKRIEAINQTAVRSAFGLVIDEPGFLKQIDSRIVLDEREALVIYDERYPWAIDDLKLPPLDEDIWGLSPNDAGEFFMTCWDECMTLPLERDLQSANRAAAATVPSM